MRHAAGAEDHDAQILGIGFHRLAQGLAQIVAAPAGGRGILDDVDAQRDDRARPRLGLPEHEGHRHGKPVIDRHLVDDGEVEFVEDDRLGDVPGEIGMALHHRHRARAPALVGGRELFGAAQSEGRNDLERERRGVVVVDEDDHVRLGLFHPLLGRLVALEERLPIGIAHAVTVDRRADGRHMRGRDACDDPSHGVHPICCGHDRGDVLKGKAVARGELGGVIDVAAQLQHEVPLAPQHRLALRRRHGEAVEIGGLVRLEGGAVLGRYQRHAEHIEMIARARFLRIEQDRAGNVVEGCGRRHRAALISPNKAASDYRPEVYVEVLRSPQSAE